MNSLLIPLLLKFVFAAPLTVFLLAALDLLELGLELAHQELEDLALTFEIVDAIDIGLIDSELSQQVGGLDLNLEKHLFVLDSQQVFQPFDFLLIVVDGRKIHSNVLFRYVKLQFVVEVVGLYGHFPDFGVFELAFPLVELRRSLLIQFGEVGNPADHVRRSD